MIVTLALIMAALLGFTAHRAGICAVKAVGEVVTTKRARMLLSFGKTVLWIMAVMLPLSLLVPGHMAPMLLWPTPLSILGAAVFGVGAAINGGCAVSTVTRLGAGEMRMLITIGGMAVGLAIIDGHGLILPISSEAGPTNPFAMRGWLLTVVTAVLWMWAAWELVRLWRGRVPNERFAARLLHRRWRLSTAAAVVGLANAVVAMVAGHWAYTGTLRQSIHWTAAPASMGPAALNIALFAALLGGVTASALLRGGFHLKWRPAPGWILNFAGGALMGFGIATVPGGNDGLLLDALPSLSPHAVPAFVALLLGIGLTQLIMRLFSPLPRIDCSGDLCPLDYGEKSPGIESDRAH